VMLHTQYLPLSSTARRFTASSARRLVGIDMEFETVRENGNWKNGGIVRRQHKVRLARGHDPLAMGQLRLQLDFPEPGLRSELEAKPGGPLNQSLLPFSPAVDYGPLQALDEFLLEHAAEQGGGIEIVQRLDYDALFSGRNHRRQQLDTALAADFGRLMLEAIGSNAAITPVGVVLFRTDQAAGA
jgi:hypothetical protein